MAPPRSVFSPAEKDFIVRLKMRPKRIEADDPLFESALREVAEGKAFATFEIAPIDPSMRDV